MKAQVFKFCEVTTCEPVVLAVGHLACGVRIGSLNVLGLTFEPHAAQQIEHRSYMRRPAAAVVISIVRMVLALVAVATQWC